MLRSFSFKEIYQQLTILFTIFYQNTCSNFVAMTNETDYEEVRMPTGTWSGFGFSKSMPESTLKDLVSYSLLNFLGNIWNVCKPEIIQNRCRDYINLKSS